MQLPGFSAEASLGRLTRGYHGTYLYDTLGSARLPGWLQPSQLEAEEVDAWEQDEDVEMPEEAELEEPEALEGE